MPISKPTVLRPKQAVPEACLRKVNKSEYRENIKKTRMRTSLDWREEFKGQIVGEIPGKKYNICIMRRLEFDAELDADFMVMAIPRDDKETTPWDFDELIEKSPEDAKLMLDITYKVQEFYHANGFDHTMAVLNTSSRDSGGTVRVNENSEEMIEKERVPQSLMFAHIKVDGYRGRNLVKEEVESEEEQLINRPLQKELDTIVAYLAQIEDIHVDDKSSPLKIYADGQIEKLLKLYSRINNVLTVISIYASGGVPLVARTMYLDDLSELKERHSNWIGENLRVSGSQVIKNIEITEELMSSGIKLFFEEKDPQLNKLIADYLFGLKIYVEKRLSQGEDFKLIYGPCFSSLVVLNEQGEKSFTFVDANTHRKGANTTSGIIPRHEKRALSGTERDLVIEGNEKMISYMQQQKDFEFVVHDDFDKEENYFSHFQDIEQEK